MRGLRSFRGGLAGSSVTTESSFTPQTSPDRANLCIMLPGIEEALIGAGGLVVAAGLGIGAARVTLRGTLQAALTTVSAASNNIQKQIQAASADVGEQLAADREHRVWERRAATYTDAIAGIQYQQKIRGFQIVVTRVGTDREWPKSPVDWVDLEARMIAFSSTTVLKAQMAYTKAARRFHDEYEIFQEDTEQARQIQESVSSGVIPQTFPQGRNSREDLDKARDEADQLGDQVMRSIRYELHGSTDPDL
jgi:hypothetical protein